MITFRRAILPDDYTGIARVLNAENPEWPTSAEKLAYEDSIRDPKFHWAFFVAEDTSSNETQLVGMASVGHDPGAHREGKFMMNIRIHPEWQGRGVGLSLYQTLLDHLEPLKPRELYTRVWAAHPRAVRFVTERGFVEVWRRFDGRLDVSQFDFTPYEGLEERVNALGIEIKTYAELENDLNRLAKLYELDRVLWRDIPYGEELSHVMLEQFEKEEIRAAKFIPEACFIAVHEGEFVGYSNLTRAGEYFDVEMTGVLPKYRGKGVATLLKLYDIRYAQEHGNREIWTVNDTANIAILALNAKLGFQRQGATIRFMKRFGGEA
jgi:mycothiol synthase